MLCDQYYLCAPDVILQEMNRKLQNLGILEVCPTAHIDPLALNLPRCEKSFKVIMQTASRVKVIAVQWSGFSKAQIDPGPPVCMHSMSGFM